MIDFASRRRCDHRGTGDGSCPTCDASPQRKWTELAATWMWVASMAVRRAEECAEKAGAEAAVASLSSYRAAVNRRASDLRLTMILLDGLDWHAAREALDRSRRRADGLAKVREALTRRRAARGPEHVLGVLGARCEAPPPAPDTTGPPGVA